MPWNSVRSFSHDCTIFTFTLAQNLQFPDFPDMKTSVIDVDGQHILIYAYQWWDQGLGFIFPLKFAPKIVKFDDFSIKNDKIAKSFSSNKICNNSGHFNLLSGGYSITSHTGCFFRPGDLLPVQ